MDTPREKQRKKSKDPKRSEHRSRKREGAERREKKHHGDGEVESADEDDQRRLERQLKKAKKIAKQLATLGLDENGDELDSFSLTTFPVREWKFTIPGMRDHVALNPAVTVLAVVGFWTLAYWCNVDTVNAMTKLDIWSAAVSLNFTWLYSGTKVVFCFYMLFIAYKYGHIHLGNHRDKPEFSTIVYSGMIFLVGGASALIVYGVSEPLSFREYHFYAMPGYRSEDELDMFAINLTVVDWGIGWATSTVVAVAMSLSIYRFKLPATFRSCFHPMLGAYTWGWIGDVIDGFSILVTLAATFANLGVTVSSIVSGLVYMQLIETDGSREQMTAIQNVTVWIITIVSLVSVLSGLHSGLKFLCITAMGLAIVLLFSLMVMDDTKYLMNLQVQEVGSYLQSGVFELNFWTDTFGQLREGSGRAVDGKAAEQWWMSSWFNFTQSWWVAGSAMNGQFVASISRGRKLWEVVAYSLVLPTMYGFAWFCVWGGTALRQSRQALEMETLGETYFNNSAHFLTSGNEFCYDVPQNDIVIDDVVVFTNHLLGVTPVCMLDEENHDSAIYNVLNSFSFPESFGHGGFGPTLSLLSILACAVLYMANAGAASLTIDKMASSGRKNNHLARRLFWLVSVGALATTLLSTGGKDALAAVQAIMIVCGLPCVVLLCCILQSITLMCQQATLESKPRDYQFPNQPEFAMPVYGGVLNVFEYCFSLGKVNPMRLEQGMGHVTSVQASEFIKGLVIPFVSLRDILMVTYPANATRNNVIASGYAVCYVAWIGLSLVAIANGGAGWTSLVWFAWAMHGGILTTVRFQFRTRHNIHSNYVADVVASMLAWPQVLTQIKLYRVALPMEADVEDEASTNEIVI